MSFSERKFGTSSFVDDTHQLICLFENAQNVNRHTEYTIRVRRNPSKDSWQVSRRYKEFLLLNTELQMSNIVLPLPKKKLIGNMQPSFVAERQMALQNYILEIQKRQILSNSLPVKRFLDPKHYSISFYENALQHVSIALRGDGDYELKQPLQNIGWRIRKNYFMVTNSHSNEEDRLLVWQTFGPDRHLSDKSLQLAYKSLQSICHPLIDKPIFMHSLESGAYSIRKVYPSGTLKDIIYGTQFSSNYLAKYGNPKNRRPLTVDQLAHYGAQILQALKFLHERGLPYGHLHVGNIAIENQRVLLLDIENGILGVPFFYRPYILELKKVTTMEAVDVYCFGHTLYEMAYALPLEQATCDKFPIGTSPELESLLKSILSQEAHKQVLPTLEELLSHQFFTSATVNGYLLAEEERYHLKFPLQIKEQIKEATSYIITRLKSDQKEVRRERRQVRIQEILNSEEEMKKQIRKAKKRETNLSRSHSSLNGTNSNSAVSPTCTNGSSLGARSNSIASSISNVSSLTHHQGTETAQNSTSTSVTPSSAPGNGRSALLNAICSFNKNNLKNISGV